MRRFLALLGAGFLLVGGALALYAANSGTVLTDDHVRTGAQLPRMHYARAETTTTLAVALDPGYAYAVHTVRYHQLNPNSSGTITIQMDAAAGSQHDVILQTKDMSTSPTTVMDWVWQPTRPVLLDADDKTSFTFRPDSNTTGGVTIVWEPI